MKLVRPTTVTDSNLTSTNVSEDDYSEYVAGATYITGDRIIITGTTHKIYESLQDANIGNYPPDNLTGDTPYWLEIGSTNRWKMFDDVVGTQTENIGSIEIEIAPSGINSIGLLQVSGSTANVTVYDGATEVYNETKSLLVENAGDWYEFFYEEIEREDAAIFLDVPSTSSFTEKITIAGGVTETVKCGMCIIGKWKNIGSSQYGLDMGIKDYSSIVEDTFGHLTVLKRGNSKIMTVTINLPGAKFSEIYNTLAEYTATPALWVGTEFHSATFTYGPFKDFSVVLPGGPNLSVCSIEIAGMI